MRNTFIDTVIEGAGGRDDLIFISGDAGLGVFDELKERSPRSFLNLGVAEQNMAAFGAGLALTGCKVYLYNIIPFLMYRCYEQIRNDICYQRLPVVLVGIGSGVTYAPAGMSHYAVEDLGIAATLPNLTVISPCDAHEASAAAAYSLTALNPVYIRLAKRGEAPVHNSPVADITGPLVIGDGSQCALLFHGSVANEAVEAARILETRGISAALVSVPMLQPLDQDRLSAILEGKRLVITLEEHFLQTGLAGLVARMAAERRPSWQLMARGIPDRFIYEVNDTAGMRRLFNIGAEQLATDVERWFREN